jgi:hypothetical protein
MNEIPLEKIQKEVHQDHSTRVEIIKSIEKDIGRKVLAFFTTFSFPAGIYQGDAAMLEGVLRKMDLKKGLTLIISSPGGSGLEAERIVNVCRTYSNNDFEVLVQGQAKSAATMICFGANQIVMSKTSELGPIDPQVQLEENETIKVFSVYNIIESYKSLFKRAVATKGKLEPFIAQLEHYDEREIAEYTRQVELTNDIAVKLLSCSMMKKISRKEIEKKIQIFLQPTTTKVHGRPIFIDEARKSGLKISEAELNSTLWRDVSEYSTRLNFLTSSKYLKIIETADDNFSVSIPPQFSRSKR